LLEEDDLFRGMRGRGLSEADSIDWIARSNRDPSPLEIATTLDHEPPLR